MNQPFARSLAIMALISAAMASSHPKLDLMQIPAYTSRGKGRGVFSGRYNARKLRQGGCSRYKPHQGQKECARRRRQMGIEA